MSGIWMSLASEFAHQKASLVMCQTEDRVSIGVQGTKSLNEVLPESLHLLLLQRL